MLSRAAVPVAKDAVSLPRLAMMSHHGNLITFSISRTKSELVTRNTSKYRSTSATYNRILRTRENDTYRLSIRFSFENL